MSVYVGMRDVVEVAGPDAADYLDGQISQDVNALSVGERAWSLILQPQGKVDALFRLTRTGDDRFLLDVDAGFGELLVARLRRFLLRMDVTIDLHVWTLHAYRDEAPPIDAPIVAPVGWGDVSGIDVIGPDLHDPDSTFPRLSDHEFDRLRIEAGVPVMGAELDESTIPAEAGDVNQWASFTKGCYTGQELVARIDSRGSNTPRSLCLLRGAGDRPDLGTDVIIDDAVAGAISSVAPTPTGWCALGYIKRAADIAGAARVGGDESVTVVRVGSWS